MIALDQAYQRPNRALLLFARKLLICPVGEKEEVWLADFFGFYLGGVIAQSRRCSRNSSRSAVWFFALTLELLWRNTSRFNDGLAAMTPFSEIIVLQIPSP